MKCQFYTKLKDNSLEPYSGVFENKAEAYAWLDYYQDEELSKLKKPRKLILGKATEIFEKKQFKLRKYEESN